MKNIQNQIKSTVTKRTEKEIQRLHKIFKEEKYEYLSKIMLRANSVLETFFFDFLRFYDRCRKIQKVSYNLDFDYFVFLFLSVIKDNITQYQYENNNGKVSRNINVLVTLGLIEKKDQLENPLYLPKKTKEIKRNIYKKTGKKVRSPNYFYVPSYYKKTTLQEANSRAKRLLDNGYKLSEFSKNIVIKTFGQDFANKVFLDKRQISSTEVEQKEQVKETISFLLENYEYTCKKDIKEYIKSHYSNQKYIDTSIREVLRESEKIECRTLTIEEKAKYGIPRQSKKQYIIKRS